MTYTLTSGTAVIRDVDGASIPNAPGNTDWQTYQSWLSAGNTPTPVPAAVTAVPSQVSNYQARAQLYADGNFTAVDTAVRNSGSPVAIAAWDYANDFYRVSPFVSALKAGTPYNTDALVDTFFINASKQV